MKDADLPVEAEDRRVHVGFVFKHASVVDEIARRKAIGAVEYDVVWPHEIARVLRIEAQRERVDRDVWIDRVHALGRDVRLELSDVGSCESRLPLQIRFVDRVVVDDADAARRRQPPRYASTGEPSPPAPMTSARAACRRS